MTRELVVDGRSQQHKDAVELKAAWISAWTAGLAKSGLELPIAEDRVRFPYYGDTLDALVRELPDGDVPEVIVRGAAADTEELQFVGLGARRDPGCGRDHRPGGSGGGG